MLQQETPEDFVIATGKTTEVREFVRMAFREIGITLDFVGQGIDEVGVITGIDTRKFKQTSGYEPSHLAVDHKLVFVDPAYFRPTEVDVLVGDATKARERLGWQPKHALNELITEMVRGDIALFQKDKLLIDAGHRILSCKEF
jgi:GDPmannose 4,6-dehydratase